MYKKGLFVILISLVIHALLLSQGVFAQDSGRDAKLQAITVSPVLYEVQAVAGEKRELEGTVVNNTDHEVQVNFEFRNLHLETLIKEGKLLLEESRDSKSPGSWLKISKKSITLAPNSSEVVDFTLQVPQETEPKGYYPAIVYVPELIKLPKSDKSSLETTGKVMALIYLNVAEVKGATSESAARIVRFGVKRRIVFYPGNEFDLLFENTGDTFIHPRGKVHIYDRRGTHLSDTPTINDKFVYLTQGKELEETLSWKPEYKFKIIPDWGRYKAVGEIYHNSDQKEVSRAEATFYVIPIWHLLIGILILMISIYVSYRVLKRKLI